MADSKTLKDLKSMARRFAGVYGPGAVGNDKKPLYLKKLHELAGEYGVDLEEEVSGTLNAKRPTPYAYTANPSS